MIIFDLACVCLLWFCWHDVWIVINNWIVHLGVTQCHIYIRCKLIMLNVCFHCFSFQIDIPVPLYNLYTLISTPPLPPCFLWNFWNCPDCLFCNSTYIKCASQFPNISDSFSLFYHCYELELPLFVLAH